MNKTEIKQKRGLLIGMCAAALWYILAVVYSLKAEGVTMMLSPALLALDSLFYINPDHFPPYKVAWALLAVVCSFLIAFGLLQIGVHLMLAVTLTFITICVRSLAMYEIALKRSNKG